MILMSAMAVMYIYDTDGLIMSAMAVMYIYDTDVSHGCNVYI